MKANKILDKAAKVYVLLSLLSLLYVSMLSMINPQHVMDMVQVKLDTTDAISSIRGVYGGVGLSISIFMIYLLFQKPTWALGFLVMFWGGYALSRILTIFIEGWLGDFGSNWLLIESVLFLSGAGLLTIIGLQKRKNASMRGSIKILKTG